MAPIPGYRALRGSVRRALRTILFQVAKAGALNPLAVALSAAGGRRGVYLGGMAMRMARRNTDHTAYWRSATNRYPGDSRFLRRSIEAALRTGKVEEAEAGLAELMGRRDASADDARFVAGLSLVYQQHNRGPAVRQLVRTFLTGLRDSSIRRVAALRLSRLIFAFFGTVGCVDPAAETRRNRSRLQRMIGRSNIAAGTTDVLGRVLRCEQMLADHSALALLDTDVSLFQCELFVRHIRSRLDAREAFSFVRIGDGEAACLPYEPHLAWLARGDAKEREKIWWGKTLKSDQRKLMARRVFNATWSADCIGVPTVARFLREARLGEDDCFDRNLTGRGLRAILYAMERYPSYRGAAAPPPIFTSCHLHQELAHWDLYGDLLRGVREIAIVSCHPGLAEFMERRFDASVGRNILLPPDRVSGPALARRTSETRALPDMIEDVALELAGVPPGSLVLVGAGYPGKWLVDVARAGGSVALDVGSVFDYWLGLPTRSYLDFPSEQNGTGEPAARRPGANS